MDPAPDNDDGRRYYDRNGFTMTVSGMYNVLDSSLKDEMRNQERDFDTVTYRRMKNSWFVLSGYSGEEILYIKTYIANDTIYHLYMRYPKHLKEEYDTIVSKIARSFTVGAD
jgi:hypothetical protein